MRWRCWIGLHDWRFVDAGFYSGRCKRCGAYR
jgi:hypothetical protein